MSEEWGPWIEHDGRGCPVVGMWVHVVSLKGQEAEGIPRPTCDRPMAGRRSRWVWADYENMRNIDGVKKYRIRKPKGLTIIETILREVERDTKPVYTAPKEYANV